MDIIVTLTDKEFEVLESWLGVGAVQPWIQRALDNKIRLRVDASILKHTNLNPQKMTKDDKLTKLSKIELPTREMRDGKNR